MAATGYKISIPSFPFLLPILIPYLLIPTAFSDSSVLLNDICIDTAGNYTQNSAFANNLNTLLDTLLHQTPHDGFKMATHGKGNDQIYGLAQCRPDMTADKCADCMYYARCGITRRCPAREGMVSYDYCFLKYSGISFFGKISPQNNFTMANVDDVKMPLRNRFRDTAVAQLLNVSKTACQTPKLFARGEKLFDKPNNVTIYTMAQCGRDLSNDVCCECLKGAVEELPIYKTERYSVGGRVAVESCTVRYEIYTFLNATSV